MLDIPRRKMEIQQRNVRQGISCGDATKSVFAPPPLLLRKLQKVSFGKGNYILTSQERPKSAPYLRLKIEKGGPFGLCETPAGCNK